METSEMETKIKELLDGSDSVILRSVTGVNFDPHPYTIGPRHVHVAAERFGGLLTRDVCREVPCAHPGCNLGPDEHKFDTVAFISLLRNCTKKEIQPILEKIVFSCPGLTGVGFVDTPEKYRIS